MAQKTVMVFQDDLDGGQAVETVAFGLNGAFYEIDLSSANAARLRKTLTPWANAARRAGRPSTAGRRTTGGGGLAPTDREQVIAIRAWARSRGLAVGDRGRIPAHIVE